MKKRNDRQEAIRNIVRSQSIKTQKHLVDALEEAGYSCTQATISRDIADMGLRKHKLGVYALCEDLHLQRMIHELASEIIRSGQFVVIKAQPGTAAGIAAAIDAAELPGVMGTVSGNDTLLVISTNEDSAERLEILIDKLSRIES